MTATAAMIAEVRRKIGEPTDATYSDVIISTQIEKYPLIDERGEVPFTYDTSTQPPTQDANEDWIVTYDLNAASADFMDEKAAALAGDFDFRADGADYKRSQAYEQMKKLARTYRSRRSPNVIEQFAWPKDESPSIVVNQNDPFA